MDDSASCDVVGHGRKRSLMSNTPQRGDIMLRARVGGAPSGSGYSNSDAIHTGLVESVSDHAFTTIEGNTNSDGGREGHSVLRHTRPLSARYVFVRWANDLKIATDHGQAP